MKKKIILLLIILVLIAVCFIPVTEQKTILVKSSFFNVYNQLGIPENWKNWRTDINKAYLSTPDKVSIKGNKGAFTIQFPGKELKINTIGTFFSINETDNNGSNNYSYLIVTDKYGNKTIITVNKNLNTFNYVIDLFRAAPFSDTHIGDLKHYMETDSLIYGFNIFKTRIKEPNLIVMRKTVLAREKFTAAADMLNTLQQFEKTNNVKQMQPLIAQFLPKASDSAQVNVGLFIDKEVKSAGGVLFTRMPKGGPLYSAKFFGKFNEKQKAYNALHQYFNDQRYQQAILPFETYLDNKLPVSDTDKIKIQVNFSTYF